MHRRALFFALALLAPLPAAAQETALDSLRAAAREAPRDYDAQVALGRALLEAGHYDQAAAQLRRASRLHRDDPAALYEMARVEFARHEQRRARAQCRAIERAAQGSTLSHVCQARAFLAWNRSARAFEELQTALQQAPNDFDALLALGDAHRLRAQVAEAEDAYRRAIAANGESAAPHLGLGQLYAQAHRNDDALRELRRAHELAPNDPDVDYALGQLLSGDEAIESLRRAVSNRPSWAPAHQALGEALLHAGQNEPAVQEFRAAIERDSHLPAARTGLGRALMAAGNLDQAEQTLRDALGEVANDSDAATALADVLARTDRADEAFEQYRHAADLNPSDAAPLLSAARLALSQERPVLAHGFLQRVIGSHPNDAQALALMGDVMRGRHDVDQARHFYQRALQGEGELDRARVEQALRELH